MIARARHHQYTYDEYVRLEQGSPIKHEYLDGEIYAMAGGTPDHAALAMSLGRVLGASLPASCRAFSSDLRVRIEATGLSTYPDVSVVCGKTERSPIDDIAVINPILLVEVTSPSTEDYDRGEKLEHYQRIPSVREVVFVSHRAPRITVHRRGEGEAWTTLEVAKGESVALTSVPVTLAVDDVYRDGLEDTQ